MIVRKNVAWRLWGAIIHLELGVFQELCMQRKTRNMNITEGRRPVISYEQIMYQADTGMITPRLRYLMMQPCIFFLAQWGRFLKMKLNDAEKEVENKNGNALSVVDQPGIEIDNWLCRFIYFLFIYLFFFLIVAPKGLDELLILKVFTAWNRLLKCLVNRLVPTTQKYGNNHLSHYCWIPSGENCPLALLSSEVFFFFFETNIYNRVTLQMLYAATPVPSPTITFL